MEIKQIHLAGRLRLLFIICIMMLVGVTSALAQETSSGTEEPIENTAVQEDVNEFLGYEDLVLARYISLPYDVVMNTNVVAYFVDMGFMIIIFFPLIYLLGTRLKWPYQLGFILLCVAFLLISVPSAFLNKNGALPAAAATALETEMATETSVLAQIAYQLKRPLVNGYSGIHQALSRFSGPKDHITYPILILLLALGIILVEMRTRGHALATRAILHFLLLFSFLWLLLSSGIPWYGLLMFPLIVLFTVAGLLGTKTAGLPQAKVRKGLLLFFTGLWAILSFAYRFANYEPTDVERAKYTFMAAMAEYQIGRNDHLSTFDRTFPQFRTALQEINQEDDSYVYRVGTLIPFFIKKNDRRVLSDNFLQFFQELNREFPNQQELALALKAYGFRYIIVDLNLPANDHTKEGSLKNKFSQFMNFIYQNPQLQLIATDRIVRDPNGTPRFEVFPENVTVENMGWFAVYRIL